MRFAPTIRTIRYRWAWKFSESARSGAGRRRL